MDIYTLKNELTNKLQQIVDEYARKDEVNLQKTSEINLQLRNNIDIIKSQNEQIAELTKNNQQLEKTNHDYSTLINDLQEKILILEEVKQQEDRFDIVRVQANDIHQKDLEIERLNKLLQKKTENQMKDNQKKDNQTIDILLQSVEMKSTEMKSDLAVEKEEIIQVTETNIIPEKDEPVKDESVKDESVKEDLKSEQSEQSEDEDIEVDSIMYKKKEYYYIIGEKEKNVYEILEDDELGPIFGKWKEVKGKKRVYIP